MSARLPDPSLTRVYRLEATLGEPLEFGGAQHTPILDQARLLVTVP